MATKIIKEGAGTKIKAVKPTPATGANLFEVSAGTDLFPTDYKSILERLEHINIAKYAGTRNFVDGAITHLSPYISRGVISLQQVKQQVLKKYESKQVWKFLQELTWREYWQRVWQSSGDNIFSDLRQGQPDVAHHEMVAAIKNATTGIEAIDERIRSLYETGYLHNHVRMYVASITCNIAKAHWLQPSRWLYYHLLDGDLASNTLSWQWVAGTFSSKKYYCNQENINRYTYSQQENTFLSDSYQVITKMGIPPVLQDKHVFSPITNLPERIEPALKENLPVLIYNSYNLDPAWHATEPANRILLLEPGHFTRHAVSDKVISFITDLAKNIEGIQVLTANFNELEVLACKRRIVFKQHPAFTHYKGTAEKYDDLYPEVTGYFPSFSSYWKKCEKYMQ